MEEIKQAIFCDKICIYANLNVYLRFAGMMFCFPTSPIADIRHER